MSLDSSPAYGAFCPAEEINFTCTGSDAVNGFYWKVNDIRYTFRANESDDAFPQTINLNPPITGVEARLINASLDQNNSARVYAVSILSGNASILEGSTIQCGAQSSSSKNYTINVVGGMAL